MATGLDPREVQAILDSMRPASGASEAPACVEPRDFARPLRLAPAEREALRERAQKALPDVERDLLRTLRKAVGVELVELAEVDSGAWLRELAAPLAVVRFEIARQPGWLVWESAAASAAVELALGATAPGPAKQRELSSVERAMLRDLLGNLARTVGAALGVAVASPRAVAHLEELGSWREGGEAADPQRLHLRLELDGPAEASALSLLLPGIVPTARQMRAKSAAARCPGHLQPIAVELSARLGTSNVPLAELLALEVGDVIPLGTRVGGALRVHVEGVDCASAVLGRHLGRLAVRIESVGPPDDDA